MSSWAAVTCAGGVLAVAVTACGPDPAPKDLSDALPASRAADVLVEVGAELGLNFVHHAGLDGSFFMPQIVGSGAALFDYDNDGKLDIYLVGGVSSASESDTGTLSALYRQQADGHFIDVTEQSGLRDSGFGMGTAVGDIDNDGDLDLLLTNYGPNRLFRNDGDGGFSDISDAAGIIDDAWSTSAAFFDYDDDGFLDLYVANYVDYKPGKTCRDQSGRAEFCGPLAYPGVADFLYRNNGDGTFSDVGKQVGIDSTAGKGLGVVTADFDDNGRQDIFVANDGVANQLWLNAGDGTFSDQAFALGVAVNGFGQPEASMGVALGDVNDDLGLDLFLTHLAQETNTLYTSVGVATYQDTTPIVGLGPPSMPWTGFGTGFFDLENDGDLDLVLVNGRVSRRHGAASSATDLLAAYGEPNALMRNVGGGRFDDYCGLAQALCAPHEVSGGLLLGDIDGDGGVDVLVTNTNAAARLYRNQVPDRGGWLALRAVDGRFKRDAIGSRVYVLAGDRWMVRPVTHSYSYLVSADATTHFGLGGAPQAERIVVRWSDGSHEQFGSADAGQVVSLIRGQGVAAAAPEQRITP